MRDYRKYDFELVMKSARWCKESLTKRSAGKRHSKEWLYFLKACHVANRMKKERI